ncbi:MAG TPA: hypothetical protein VF773_05440 [Verrucomicrobiae bacterium]
MKSVRTIITIFALAAIAFGVYYFFFPPPEKVIRKRLTKLAEAISSRPEGNISMMANINRIGSFFHPNVTVSVQGYEQLGAVSGRNELQQAALAARQRLGSISVEFYNVEVLVAPDETNATVTASALVKINNDPNAQVQDVKLEFEKYDRAWMIRSATPSKSLKPQ